MWGTASIQRAFSKAKVVWAFRSPPSAEMRLHQTFTQIANTSVGPCNTNSPVTQKSVREWDSFTWLASWLPDWICAENQGLAAHGHVLQVCHWKVSAKQARGPLPEDMQRAPALTNPRWCALLSTGYWSDDQAVFQLAVTTTSGNSLLHCLGEKKTTKKHTLWKKNPTYNVLSSVRADFLLPPDLQKVTGLQTSLAAEFVTKWNY